MTKDPEPGGKGNSAHLNSVCGEQKVTPLGWGINTPSPIPREAEVRPPESPGPNLRGGGAETEIWL